MIPWGAEEVPDPAEEGTATGGVRDQESGSEVPRGGDGYPKTLEILYCLVQLKILKKLLRHVQ